MYKVNYFRPRWTECFCLGKHNPLMVETLFCSALHPLPGKGYWGLSKLCVQLFLFFLSLPEIQGALLLREPVITPAISITLF